MKTIIVTEKFNQKKLGTCLLNSLDELTTSTFYKLLRKKDIRINGKRVNENVTVMAGDEIQIYLPDKPVLKSVSFPVVYEDDNIFIVNKPAGISVTEEENSLTKVLKQNFSYLEPCHRLDRNTSGLVLFAKNSESLAILLDKFKSHEIEKHYVCIAVGLFPKKEDCLTAYLFKDAKKSTVYILDTPKKGYVRIVTGYRVLKQAKEKSLSLLDIHLQTGRTHQIRAHLAHIGHPILGDGKYGIGEVNRKWKQKAQALCAYRLQFVFSTPSGKLDYLNGKKIQLPFPTYFNEII